MVHVASWVLLSKSTSTTSTGPTGAVETMKAVDSLPELDLR
jgi:hypothetical protein